MSGISPSTKVTPISYTFNGVKNSLPLPDAEGGELASLLSSAKNKLVKEIVRKQQELKKESNQLVDAHLLFLGNVYVVRATNAKCEKITGDTARQLKKQLSE